MIKELKNKSQAMPQEAMKSLTTVEELPKISDVQSSHHSNLFKMQTDEMLSSLEIKNKTKIKINSWFKDFSKLLKEFPQSKQFQLSNLKWVKENGIDLPLKEFSSLPSLNGVFTFIAPEDVMMIGSYPLDLSSTHSKIVDVALVLPKEFLQSNDLYNGKWIVRRALYLSWLGNILQSKSDLISSVHWVYHAGSRQRPILQISPSGKLGTLWKFNLSPVPPNDFFKINPLSPTRSTVAPSWYYQREKNDDEFVPPTPYHNWVCGVDLVALKHYELMKASITNPNWIQGLKLLKVWFKQRHLNEGEACVSCHLITLYLIHLSKLKKISERMSSYQVFRTVLLHLSQSDWSKDGPSLLENPNLHDRNIVLPKLEEFHRVYEVVFVDPTGFFNVAGNVSLQAYKQLQHEAKIGLEVLESSSNCFDSLFMNKIEFHLTYDQTIHIKFKADDINKILENTEILKDAAMDRLGDARHLVFSHVVSVLCEGIGDRTDFVGVLREKIESWPYGSSTPDLNRTLTLGFLLNPRTSTNLLTKGPSADSPEASKFQEFWGEVSSLRRFRDNTLQETVLWMEEDSPVGDRRLILGKLIHYVMKKHFDIPSIQVLYVAHQLEDMLRRSYSFNEESFKYGTGEESIRLAILAFDSMAKKLRKLDLPLKVTGLQSVSDVLKHSVVFPPLPIDVPKPYIVKKSKRQKIRNYIKISDQLRCPFYRESINVQLFLEISGKWPDDLLAIKSVKFEFLRQMSKSLEDGDGITCILYPSSLQIIWEGYIFNIEVCYRREIYLLRSPRDGGDAGDLQKDTEASIELEKKIEILPRLTASLNSLQNEYPCFGGSVRLVKRWVSSQLLLPHFPPTVIDIIVAYLFLNPYPFKTPNTPHVTLLRFMNFMVSTNWNSTPVFVNLRSQFLADDESELTKRFTHTRANFPPLFLCTPCELRPLAGEIDPTAEEINKRLRLASCWSRPEPSHVILSRMKAVADAALTVYQKSCFLKSFDFKVLFKPQLKDYDVLIYLIESNLARRVERISHEEEIDVTRFTHVKGKMLPVVDFDPVQLYLSELRNAFDNEALFFHDIHGGNVIGVLWKPHVKETKEAKKSNLEKAKVVGTNDIKIVTDIDAIVEDFRILGPGLVREIKLKN